MLDVEIYLNVMGCRDVIKKNNQASNQNCTKIIIFFCHYFYGKLKTEYYTVKVAVLKKNRKQILIIWVILYESVKIINKIW